MAKAKACFLPTRSRSRTFTTGGNSAGNGGDGYNTGDISSKPSIEFNPYNKAEGADVHVNNGDKVHQKAYWDAGGANAKAEKHSKAEGGKAYSNGDQRIGERPQQVRRGCQHDGLSEKLPQGRT